MFRSVLEGEPELAVEMAEKAVAEGIPPMQCLDEGYLKGIDEVGRLYSEGEIFLPELVAAAEAMKAALKVLDPLLKDQSAQRRAQGKVVIGTMYEDIHDIGKSIVASMLTANGFEVHDLGVNVPAAVFVGKVKELQPDILGLSALLTTTMPQQKAVLEALTAAGLRDKVKVVVGGAPVTQKWAEEIGADGFAEDAIAAVALAKSLL
ncbi:hypothetical protein SY88_05285 [Clostridiales bacterium PH28_bin88]|nr:hypothetical protein SY88_05285 [Clostridiales bacterium PH28_bin88]